MTNSPSSPRLKANVLEVLIELNKGVFLDVPLPFPPLPFVNDPAIIPNKPGFGFHTLTVPSSNEQDTINRPSPENVIAVTDFVCP